MPPYSSYLLQLLDVGCFLPLKRAYKYQVESYIRLRRNYINKLDFLEAFKPTRVVALSSLNIRSGFTIARLVLYNPKRVLSRL